jgi:thiopurine S-methyltransferase
MKWHKLIIQILSGELLMEADFWHRRWTKNEIGFHEGQANALLVKHLEALKLTKGSRLFLPLCGKTRDIAWLLEQGFQVVGAELSEIAVQDLFKDLAVTPNINTQGKLQQYSAENICIYVGDIFDLSSAVLGHVDAVYDRAALVALPAPMREQYTKHVMQLTEHAPQLLICFEYDQTIMDGPPFAIDSEQVKHYYAQHYSLTLLETVDLPKGLRGAVDAKESAWYLTSSSDFLKKK